MKRLLIFFFLSFALAAAPAIAREKSDDSKYLAAGVVPVDANSIVTWHQAFAVPGKTKSEIYATMKNYMTAIEQAAIHDLRTKFMEQDEQRGSIVLRCEERMVFKKKFLNFDFTRFRYHYQVECKDGECHMTITQISYYYEEETDGTNGKTYKAEEWITDKYAVNKKRTKLYPYSGKFRRKTIDRVEAIFGGAREAFEAPKEPVEKKKNTTIIQ